MLIYLLGIDTKNVDDLQPLRFISMEPASMQLFKNVTNVGKHLFGPKQLINIYEMYFSIYTIFLAL